MKAWKKAMGALVPVNDLSLESFDLLRPAGSQADTREAKSFLAAYRTEAERATLLEEIEHIHAAGQDIEFDVLTGDQARAIEPSLSDEIGAAILPQGPAVHRPGHLRARPGRLGAATRGGKIMHAARPWPTSATPAAAWTSPPPRAPSRSSTRSCWRPAPGSASLARQFGVRTVVQAGRGYSFSVPIEHVPDGPVYFPAQRVACTPIGDRLRVAGMMEFRRPEAAL